MSVMLALRIPPVSPFKEKPALAQPPIPKKRNPAQNKSSMKRRWGEGGNAEALRGVGGIVRVSTESERRI